MFGNLQQPIEFQDRLILKAQTLIEAPQGKKLADPTFQIESPLIRVRIVSRDFDPSTSWRSEIAQGIGLSIAPSREQHSKRSLVVLIQDDHAPIWIDEYFLIPWKINSKRHALVFDDLDDISKAVIVSLNPDLALAFKLRKGIT